MGVVVKKIPRVLESLDGVGGTLMLQYRETELGGSFELIVGGYYVMAATDGPTERMLSSEALKNLPSGDETNSKLTVLVGGLGLGLTLNEILKERRVTDVWVAEIEEAVIRWNKTYLRDFNGDALFDERVNIHHTDVMGLIEKRRHTFDVILMDVDNGPSFLIHEGNGFLYGRSGMKKVKRSLKRGGVFALWAHCPDDEIEIVLEKVFGGFNVKLIKDTNLREDLPPTAIYTAIRH